MRAGPREPSFTATKTKSPPGSERQGRTGRPGGPFSRGRYGVSLGGKNKSAAAREKQAAAGVEEQADNALLGALIVLEKPRKNKGLRYVRRCKRKAAAFGKRRRLMRLNALGWGALQSRICSTSRKEYTTFHAFRQ